MDDRFYLPPVTRQQLGAILAGLRLYEAVFPAIADAIEQVAAPGEDVHSDPIGIGEAVADYYEETTDCVAIDDVASDGGTLEALAPELVDDLCAYLNCPTPANGKAPAQVAREASALDAIL